MCGIAGIVGGAPERHREHLSRMLAALTHRGPDDEGRHAEPGRLLGHRRLSIVACAAEAGHEVQTFSVDLEGGLTETPFARDVATRYFTRHVELSCNDYDVATDLLRMGRNFDEPVGDSSAIPTYLIAREARKHVKVVVTGDGVDKLCGGYSWYRPLTWMQEAQRGSYLELKLARLALGLRSRLGLLRDPDARHRADGVAMATRYASVLAAHEAQLQLATAADLARLGLPGVERRPPWGDESPGAVDGLDTTIRADVVDYMPGDILVKILLRKAFERDWPASVRSRSKQGFGAPVELWLTQPRGLELEHELLRTRSSPLYDFMAFDGAQAALKSAPVLLRWALLALGVWAKENCQVWSGARVTIPSAAASP